MKTNTASQEGGHMLLMVMVFLAIGLVMVSGIFAYSSSNAKQNARHNEYYTSLGAAEAATETVLAHVVSDFRTYSESYVVAHLDTYRRMVPTPSESPYWSSYDFQNLSGNNQRMEVQFTQMPGYQVVGGTYGKLKAFKDRVRIVANAKNKNSVQNVTASVYQDIELTRIPIFQYGIFYNILLEFTPLPPMVVTGPVHCNTNIYLNPGSTLTFLSDVTSSGTIFESVNPASPIFPQSGTIDYSGNRHDSGVSTLSLPIGTNNSPAAVQQVLQIPPAGEDPLSSLGSQRYYNKADLIVLVSNTNVTVKTGLWDNFSTVLTTNDFPYISTNTSFYNKREQRTILPIQIDVSRLVKWNATNKGLRPYLPYTDVTTVYVGDLRTFSSSYESGVRLINGSTLPPSGLTVATTSPLYIQGDYNAPASALGTTNTLNTVGASVACDAITILSGNWKDSKGNNPGTSRNASDTTVNCAFLTGIVATTASSDSGGVENFPRFLEDWTGRTFTYNGSMVAMFYSQIATGPWLGIMPTYDIYYPPTRNWSLDQNYTINRFPPNTPALIVLVRADWRTPAAYTTNILAGF